MAKPMPSYPEQPENKKRRVCADIDEALHRRIKAHCATHGLLIGDVLRELLEREWPAGRTTKGKAAA